MVSKQEKKEERTKSEVYIEGRGQSGGMQGEGKAQGEQKDRLRKATGGGRGHYIRRFCIKH